ncbi:E3 ubiquitin-protein ligase RNF13-like isoform X2 [Vespula pensylvanica]|uniref:E3 ubiquitin-protein ligase RNF13-like isoform X2 n=1 Tax=Vespula pensylvanica TaxID=30213 RepID=UPI001CBA3A75|nr:E3 ubiquitin-protein ligase RNF13-like isoform X2 [Vespula pensylvanica]
MQQCCVSHQVQLWLLLLLLCVAYCGADILVFSAGTRYQVDDEFRDMPARFGGFIPSEGIKGMVVYAQPPTACHEIQGPPNDTSYEGNWIALIARYECKFEIKVRMAQKAGYDAAIIHNVNSNELEPMSAEDPIGIQIPSVFVSELTGLIIKENYLCIKDRRRQLRHRLPNSSLNKIPTHKYTKGDPYETCAICLDDYTEGEKLRVLPCAHAYHSKCIDPWLTKNRRVCPVCKRKVFAADEQVVTDESDSDADDSTPLIRDGYQGTQGGTFIRQRENPFNRSRRTQHRQDTNNSSSGSDSESSSTSSDDDGSISTGEPSGGIVFMVSDSHSINGELQDLERSVSSTRPHTVNLYTETQEFPVPVVQITPARNTRVLVNSATLNPDHLAIAADNRSASTTSIDFEKNDVAA